MNKAEIFNSTESLAEPPPTLSLELQSLWWLKKGDWDKAHDLAQDVGSKQGDWIHAHLHRIEGDLANAAIGIPGQASQFAEMSFQKNGKR